VPQAWTPETDRLVSKKMALPATAATDRGAGAGVDVLSLAPPPPHEEEAAIAIAKYRRPTHPITFFEFIRIHPTARSRPRVNTIANAIENNSHLQPLGERGRMRATTKDADW
jgi:hypothetical protein